MHRKVAALGETLRDLQLTHSTEAAGSDPDRSTVNQKPPLLAEAEIRARLASWRGLVSPDLPRYRVQRTIGEGSTSRIFEVFDGSLNRPVALKVLLQGGHAAIERTQRFIAEAVATASFDHPGVPAIFDVDIGVEGSVFYTMKLVEGRTLGSLIQAWTEGRDPAMPFAERVGIILRVTNAVEAAHAHGLVHRDIKPDNVMLGRFGEVYLVDWGAATRVSEEIRPGRRVGTPLFMSPQAAQGMAPDPADDVYSLGATLFTTLLLRPPLDGDDPARFWEQKVVGEFDPPTAAERRRVPRRLLAIAQHAIAPMASQRYASAAALRLDLEAWLSGGIIQACSETPAERLQRWHRRHGRVFWRWLAAGVVVLALIGALYGERLKAVATWGEPTVHETFADDDWRTRWEVREGSVERRGGALVTTSAGATFIDLRQRLEGPIAVEYTGALLPDSPPCDISLEFSPRQQFARNIGIKDTAVDYRIQLGAFDGSYSAIIASTSGHHDHVSYSDFRPESGRKYRVRIEIIDRDLRVSVDGATILAYQTTLPFNGGFISLHGFYRGKSFSDVRIYSLGMPQRMSATAIGDAFTSVGDHTHAREQYARVGKMHAGNVLGDEARYKQGLSCAALGDHAAADAAWAMVNPGLWRDLSRLAQLDRQVDDGHDDVVLRELPDLYQGGSAELRRRIPQAWNRWAVACYDRQRLERWLEIRDRLFPHALETEYNAAETLLRLYRNEEMLARFPHQTSLGVSALVALGRLAEIPELLPRQRWFSADALMHTGRSAEIAARYPENRRLIQRGYYVRGQIDEALADPAQIEESALLFTGQFARIGKQSPARLAALIFSGKADEALQEAGSNPESRALSLLALDRLPEIVETGPSFETVRQVAIARAFAALQSGPRGPARAQVAFEVVPQHPAIYGKYRMWGICLPAALAVSGERGAFDAWLARLMTRRWDAEQHTWHDAAFLLGRIGEPEFLAQPHGLFASADLHLLRAIRSDVAGRPQEALPDYRAWLAVPAWQRSEMPEPTIDRFVAWRVAALQQGTH